MSDDALHVSQISRSYGRQPVVREISFALQQGEVLGFLGANGAGKSTTLQMLAGILAPDAGHIHICGIDLARHPLKAKAQIGYLPEIAPLYMEMTVDAYLRFAARLRRIEESRLGEAVESAKARCGLSGTGSKFIAHLSRGYRQRLGIAQAILHAPRVVILDEPTAGLDPLQTREIHDLVRALGETSGVILSSHSLAEVEQVCDRVQIMREGQLVFSGNTDELESVGGLADLFRQFAQPEGAQP